MIDRKSSTKIGVRNVLLVEKAGKTEFKWRTIRNNICQLKPETIERISRAIVGEGHRLKPAAIEKVRAEKIFRNS